MGKNSLAGRKIKRTLSGWTQDQRDGPSSNVTVVWGEPMDSVTIASVRRLTGVLVPLCRSLACEHAGSPGGRTWVQGILGSTHQLHGPPWNAVETFLSHTGCLIAQKHTSSSSHNQGQVIHIQSLPHADTCSSKLFVKFSFVPSPLSLVTLTSRFVRF